MVAKPSLASPIATLPGVGHQVEERLKRLHIRIVQDLLFHLPIKYQDKTRLTPIEALQVGQAAMVEGTISWASRRRRVLLCRLSDGTGALVLRFFHYSRAQYQRLQPKAVLRCYGQVRRGQEMLEIVHPEYQHIDPDAPPAVNEHLTAIYPLTKDLRQRTIQKLTAQALTILKDTDCVELLPDELLARFALPDLVMALLYVHQPPPEADLPLLVAGSHTYQKRLAFEELLSQHLSLRRIRQKTQARQAPPLSGDNHLRQQFIRQLQFALTPAQKKVLVEIAEDLQKDTPMLRLLQGEVGAGKTVVSAIAALQALESGYQVALMAPTDLLAEQHYQTFKQWFEDSDIPVLLVTGKIAKSVRDNNAAVLNEQNRVIAIGTHALFQKHIQFSKLGLIIIDEQHRFGVHQRLSLLDKGADRYPHQLIMTATPIPRTLAMTVYADLDISIIDMLPPNRQPINTAVLSNTRRDEIIARINHVCSSGRQVYWICTLIEESETLQCRTAMETQRYLAAKLSEINIGLIHGRMKPKEKEAVMEAFRAKAIQLLVATTVIEVGVDVPNASLMIIENAERLGLFQLHQLRGRVGRGNIKSDCVLMYQAPLSDLARARLEVMRNTNNGFEIARKDLALRGPGDLVGTRQTGLPALRIANIIRDANMLPEVRQAAQILQAKNPERVDLLTKRWLNNEADYSNV